VNVCGYSMLLCTSMLLYAESARARTESAYATYACDGPLEGLVGQVRGAFEGSPGEDATCVLPERAAWMQRACADCEMPERAACTQRCGGRPMILYYANRPLYGTCSESAFI
jgi:hypothetical protein